MVLPSTATRIARLPALLLALLPLAAAAQQGERLPDLTPSVFEIQGELEVDLPQLERQPLWGFGPPPRSFEVSADRQPPAQPYGPPFDGLVPLALAPPPDPRADLPEGRVFRAEAAIGIEAARSARLDAAGRTGPVILFLSGAYDGVGPTVVFGDEPPSVNGEVRFERFDVSGGVRSTGPVRGGLEGRYIHDAYSLPGALLGSPFEPERAVSHGALTGTLDVDGAVPAALRLGFARTALDHENFPGPGAVDPAETRFHGSGSVELLRRLVRAEGAFGTSSFLEASNETDLVDYAAGLVLQAHRPGGAQFALGARVLGYQTSFLNGDASTTVFAPVVRVEVPVGLVARLFAYTDPGLVQRGFAGLLAENPYAAPTLLAPDVHTVDARAGLEVRAGAVGLKLYGGAVYSPTRLYFERGPDGLFSPGYADARVFLGGGDVTVATASGVEATAGLAYRDGRLTEFDEPIPYFASTVGRAGLQVPFDRGRGRLGLAAYAEGSRPTTRSPEGRPLADGWATLSAYGAYEVAGGLSVVLRGERLAGRAERWEGYPQVPYAVMAGVRFAR